MKPRTSETRMEQMMLRHVWKVAFILIIAGWLGCSTDVDLTAPYQRTPVIFALLDAQQDTQWVRINRTWLGDGNQFDAALIADSSEYPPEELTVEVRERNSAQDTTALWFLQDTLIDVKSEDGIFYAPSHQMWFFVPEGGLDTDAEYDMHVDISDGTVAEATTNMIANQIGNITQPPPGLSNFKYGFASIGFQTTYPNIKFKWSSTAGARRYDISLNIHITERIWNDLQHTDLFEERERVIVWNVGSLTTQEDDGGEVLQKEVSGERFFSTLAVQLEASPYITRVLGVWDDNVQIARAIDFELAIANDELATYLEINSPVTGVIQERPEYTNILNGLGLFAARAKQGVYGIGYNTATIQHLMEGDATAMLNFCSANPFSEFYCD